jgi:glucose-6-phosphate 1-dehydrogenase
MTPRQLPFVLFGATGDLARRMLLPALLSVRERHPEYRLDIVGVAGSRYDDEQFRAYVVEVLTKDRRCSRQDAEAFAATIRYLSGDYHDQALFERLAAIVSPEERPIVYLAIPPNLFEVVVEHLAAAGFAEHARVMVEKPFGRNLADAQRLSGVLARYFLPEQVYRIDHFLGKEAVQNLLVFRFANSILEPLWNRNYVSRIELSMLESFGVEGRGSFYDNVGVIRDVVQNHLLQLLTLLLMEPPLAMSGHDLTDQRTKVLQAIRPIRPDDAVLAQYRGYRLEPGVAEDSTTPTYAAIRLEVNSWRWAGVPVFVRAGKGLRETRTEAVVEFRRPPTLIFGSGESEEHQPEPNAFVFHFKPDGRIELLMQTKVPGPRLISRPTTLTVASSDDSARSDDAYAQLIDDVVRDDHTRFATQESVEAAWRIVEPILDAPAETTYVVGTDGPREASRLLGDVKGWYR